jgi:hypothetical protein
MNELVIDGNLVIVILMQNDTFGLPKEFAGFVS